MCLEIIANADELVNVERVLNDLLFGRCKVAIHLIADRIEHLLLPRDKRVGLLDVVGYITVDYMTGGMASDVEPLRVGKRRRIAIGGADPDGSHATCPQHPGMTALTPQLRFARR